MRIKEGSEEHRMLKAIGSNSVIGPSINEPKIRAALIDAGLVAPDGKTVTAEGERALARIRHHARYISPLGT
jgi:hypothetical protein